MTTATARPRFMHYGDRIVGRVRVTDSAPRCSTVARSRNRDTLASTTATSTPSVAEMDLLHRLWWRMRPNAPHLPEPGETGYTELCAAAAAQGLMLDASPADY